MLRTLLKSEHGGQSFMQFGAQMLLKERYKVVKAASDAHGSSDAEACLLVQSSSLIIHDQRGWASALKDRNSDVS